MYLDEPRHFVPSNIQRKHVTSSSFKKKKILNPFIIEKKICTRIYKGWCLDLQIHTQPVPEAKNQWEECVGSKVDLFEGSMSLLGLQFRHGSVGFILPSGRATMAHT